VEAKFKSNLDHEIVYADRPLKDKPSLVRQLFEKLKIQILQAVEY
jgi:hypothetical protein